MTTIFLIQTVFMVFVLAYTYYAYRTKVPLVMTQKAALKVILDIVQADIQSRPSPKVKIYDLGSGIGGLCLATARAFPEAEIVGLELAWPVWLIAVLRQKLSGCRNLRFHCGDFWNRDISDGDIVLCYLGDVVMAPLQDKLRREPCANRLFVSNTFPLPADWPPVQRIPIPGAVLSKEIYIYRQTA